MGAAAATIWYSDIAEPKGLLAVSSRPDPEAAAAIAAQVLGAPVTGRPAALAEATTPESGSVTIGTFGGLTMVAHESLSLARPSELDASWLRLLPAQRVFLLCCRPADAMGAFAHWSAGNLIRSFSAHPVDIIEDIGMPSPFEGPFWAGEHPLAYAPGVVPDPRALPFHPMEFAEQANREWLGFRYTHPLADTDFDPSRIPVTVFTPAAAAAGDDAPSSAIGLSPAGAAPAGSLAPSDAPPAERGAVRRFFGF